MGIWDSLTDAFTGAPAKRAAEQQRAFLDQTRMQGNTDIGNALTAGTGAVQQGFGTARGDVGAGYADASGALAGARDAYAPLSALSQKYGGATNLALGALGVGGQDAMTAARDAFTAGPGYQFNMDQGLEAIMRNRNARGEVAGGNADRDAQVYGAGLASQEYDKWLGNLLGFTSPELSATSGAATGLAGIGRDQAGLASDRGRMLADLASREGTTLAGLQTGAAGQKVGLASSLASPYSKTYGDEAAAEMAGSANLWNLGLQGAKLAAGGLGGLGGGGLGIPAGGTATGAVGLGGWRNPDFANRQYGGFFG